MRDNIKRSLILILSIILMTASPLQAIAANGNGTGDAVNGANRHVTGGVSYKKAAYLIYIVDEDGNAITPK